MLRHLALVLLLVTPALTLACGGDDEEAGACSVCDQAADAACQSRCEEVCDICSDVTPSEVEDVVCFGDTLNVQLTDNSTIACSG